MPGIKLSSASCNWRWWVVMGMLTVLLAGCGPETAPAALPTRTPVPTYTPTPEVAAAALTVAPAAASTNTPLVLVATPVAAEPAPAVVVEPTATAAPPAAAAAGAQLTITGDLVNVRRGPGTAFELVGTATAGANYDVIARNAAGDWWQVCCFDGQSGWIFGELATVTDAASVTVAADQPTATAVATPDAGGAPVAEAVPATTPAAAIVAPENTPAPVAAYDPTASSAGNFDPNAQYQIVHFKVLGLEENNGGIRDSGAQHHIFLTVLDASGAGIDGVVVRNPVGDRSEAVTGGKGPGKAEIAMYYEPVKLAVVSDPSGPVTSQVSNQMGLIFPHLPDIVGKLGDINYEYGACPTIDIKCKWPLSDVNFLHFSYEITFQKVK